MSIKYTTTIDTIGMQIDLDNEHTQIEVLYRLLDFMKECNFYVREVKVEEKYLLYAHNKIIATVSTGLFNTGSYINNEFRTKYYVGIKFAGLMKYKENVDNASNGILLAICAYLNSRSIIFKLTELDVCIDVECAYENILAVCTKKSPKTHYHALTDDQVYATTSYIEKIEPQKRDKAVLRAYTYNKSHKEKLSNKITRFEIKLQPKYFSKYGFSIDNIQKAFDRYYVMYFNDIEEKERKIEKYQSYQHVYKREINALGFDNYRLHADMDYIEHFIYTIHSVGTVYDFSTYIHSELINTIVRSNNSYAQ